MKSKISGNPVLTVRNNSDLYVDGIKAQELIDRYKSPFFIYSEKVIRLNCKGFLKLLKNYFKRFQIFYSYKSNPFPQICEIIHSEGIGAEVVSLQELDQALGLKLENDNICIGTPYLTNELLKLIFSKKINNIGCWSLPQMEQIVDLSKNLQSVLDIMIRIRPNSYKKTLGIKISKENCQKIINLLDNTSLKITGLHSHYSTQMMKENLYIENLNLILETYEILESMGFNSIDSFNLGGGFPEASILKLEDLDKIFSSIKDRMEESGFNNKNIIFEPGRYFISDAGMVFSKILDIFNDFDEKWIRLNIGTNFLPRTSKSNFKFFCINKITQPNIEQVNILGNLPSEMDFFAKNYLTIKDIEMKDNILITNAGAYTQTWSTHFPYPKPQHLLIRKDKNVQELIP
ncbi:MAG: hypothetical protein EAX96_00880 [Candidatus Lokiarchaeota archaeon]|nr:hypothetical protein [Candidatus Lokiarchaeota archaeon]